MYCSHIFCLSVLLVLLSADWSEQLGGSSLCQEPSSPPHGSWYCPKSESVCHLECDPGYAPTSSTTAHCIHGNYSLPSFPTCSPAVALVTGGLLASSTVEIYGPHIHRRLPDLPDSRVGHTLDYVDGFIVACGGSTMKGPPVDPPPPSLATCIRLKQDLSWEPHSRMTYTRDIAASAVNLGQLNILGGSDHPNKRETLRPDTGSGTTWTKTHLDTKTKYTCAAKISATEFLATGGAYSPKATLSYNTVTGKVTNLRDMTQERSGHGCAFVKAGGMEGVVVAGGFPAGGAMWTQDVSRAITDHAEFYDVRKKTWRNLGKLNHARRGLKLVFVQGVLYAMGGFNGTNYVKTVEQFDFHTETWKYVEDMFSERAFPGVVAVPVNILQQSQAANLHSVLLTVIAAASLAKFMAF